MARKWAKKFYNSKEWIACRKAYIQSVNYLCERCLKKNKYVGGHIVHHKTYLTPFNVGDPDITLNHTKLEYVCKDCHDKEHGIVKRKQITREGTTFNNKGELIRYEREEV